MKKKRKKRRKKIKSISSTWLKFKCKKCFSLLCFWFNVGTGLGGVADQVLLVKIIARLLHAVPTDLDIQTWEI